MKVDFVIQKSRRSSISIHVSRDEKIIVKAPASCTQEYIEDFLHQKRDWILKQLEKVRNRNQALENLGSFTDEEISEMKKKARVLIPQRVEFYAGQWGFSYNRIFIRLQKSRWGSCSSDKNLNFNCLLVLMPPEILDSVVVHELCHLHHMNHSRAFYDEVLKIFPDYKKCSKWLKQNGTVYLMRAGK